MQCIAPAGPAIPPREQSEEPHLGLGLGLVQLELGGVSFQGIFVTSLPCVWDAGSV